jgi:hypothetical protein
VFRSQDDEIVLDICACLITLLQDHPDLVTSVLELGFVRKMREILESHNAASHVYELALLVLCGVLRCPDSLCRTVVLSSAASQDSAYCQPVGRPMLQRQHTSPESAPNVFGAFASPTLDSSTNSFAFGSGVVSPSGGFNFGSEDAAMTDDSTAAAAGGDRTPAAVPTHSTLAYIIRHLGRSENALTRSDICRSLLCVVDMGARYAEVCVQCGLEAILGRLMAQDAFDLKVDAGGSTQHVV